MASGRHSTGARVGAADAEPDPGEAFADREVIGSEICRDHSEITAGCRSLHSAHNDTDRARERAGRAECLVEHGASAVQLGAS